MIKVLHNLQTFVFFSVSLLNVGFYNASIKFRIAVPVKQSYNTEYANPFNTFDKNFYYFTF